MTVNPDTVCRSRLQRSDIGNGDFVASARIGEEDLMTAVADPEETINTPLEVFGFMFGYLYKVRN